MRKMRSLLIKKFQTLKGLTQSSSRRKLQARVRSNFKLIEKRAAVNNHKLGIECRI
jgi:hypothetical protein